MRAIHNWTGYSGTVSTVSADSFSRLPFFAITETAEPRCKVHVYLMILSADNLASASKVLIVFSHLQFCRNTAKFIWICP